MHTVNKICICYLHRHHATECFAIIEGFRLISNFSPNILLIAFNSLFCLQSLFFFVWYVDS